MESFVKTTAQLGGLFPFGTTLMKLILTDGGETLVTYLAMDAANRSPYDILYKDFVATIIMKKNCGYESLKEEVVATTYDSSRLSLSYLV